MKQNFQLKGKKIIGKGHFLRIEELDFVDRRNKKRKWESVCRENSYGATIIIAEIVPDNKLILVKQFRPPAWRQLLEFPAGLIDPGENAAATAIRELREETGFEGEVIKVLPESFSSPGMSCEKMFVVMMRVDGNQYRNGPPQHFQEENEDIETILADKTKLLEFLEKEAAAGIGIDAKLLHYAIGLHNL